MSRTILHEFERRLEERVQRGEITASTRDVYLNKASRVFEVLLKRLPPSVIEGYLKAEGYRGHYGYVIRSLNELVRGKRQTSFPAPPKDQPRLLDV